MSNASRRLIGQATLTVLPVTDPEGDKARRVKTAQDWLAKTVERAGIPVTALDDCNDKSSQIVRLIGPIAAELHKYVKDWPIGWRIVVSGGDEQQRARVSDWLACLAARHRSSWESTCNTLIRKWRMVNMVPYLSDKSYGSQGAPNWQAQISQIKSPQILVILEVSPRAMPLDRFGGSVLSSGLSQRVDAGKPTIITVASDDVMDIDRLGDEAHNAIYGGEQRRKAIGVRIQKTA